VVYGLGLENQRNVSYRGFESHPLRNQKKKNNEIENWSRFFRLQKKKKNWTSIVQLIDLIKGERRGLNPRMMESQSIALPLGYARLHSYVFTIDLSSQKVNRKSQFAL
jgi:hypothetical protein